MSIGISSGFSSMSETTELRETYQIKCMQCGFNHALYHFEEFFENYEHGIKTHRLANYKGMKLIIKKLIEKKREFFIKGKDIEISYTEQELEALRYKSKKKTEKAYKGD